MLSEGASFAWYVLSNYHPMLAMIRSHFEPAVVQLFRGMLFSSFLSFFCHTQEGIHTITCFSGVPLHFWRVTYKFRLWSFQDFTRITSMVLDALAHCMRQEFHWVKVKFYIQILWINLWRQLEVKERL